MEEIKRIREVAKYLERSSAIDIADELNQCCDLLKKKLKALGTLRKYITLTDYGEKYYNKDNRYQIRVNGFIFYLTEEQYKEAKEVLVK